MQGLAAAKASGKKSGRPKGSRDKERVLDPYREQIKDYLYDEFAPSSTRNWRIRSATLPTVILFAKIQSCLSCGSPNVSKTIRMLILRGNLGRKCKLG